MNSLSYFLGFFVLLVGIFSIEYFFAPPILHEGNKELYEENTNDITIDIQRNPLQTNEKENIFANTSLENIIERRSEEIGHIFHIMPLNTTDDQFRVLKTEYFEKNESEDLQKILVKYEIYSTKPRSIEQSLSDIKKKMTVLFEDNIEAQVLEEEKYGQKSFSIRLEENPKTMYFVVAYRDRLLGFEYPLGENFSRRDELEKVFTQLFSQ